MKTMPYFQGTGSRKTSVARVRLVPGEGTVVVNGKPLEEYFGRDGYSEAALQPFTVTNTPTVRGFSDSPLARCTSARCCSSDST